MKKRILCFGDSNTYGYAPKEGGRYDENTRWTMQLQKIVSSRATIIEEGLNGRTCVFDDPVEGGYKSGVGYLPVCLMSHNPLDLVILMLGTNDSKMRFGMTPMTIGEGMMQLIRTTRLYAVNAQGQPPRILVVAPPPIPESILTSRYAECFGPNAHRVTTGLSAEYSRVARLLRCDFFDAVFAEISPIDSLHLTAKGHRDLANGLARKLAEMYPEEHTL